MGVLRFFGCGAGSNMRKFDCYLFFSAYTMSCIPNIPYRHEFWTKLTIKIIFQKLRHLGVESDYCMFVF